MPLNRVPVATYRVQLNSDFTFQQARSIVAYLQRLGIGELYSSPILKARPGSTHGYDVIDSDELNPELGSEDDFRALHETLQGAGMGLLLDIVPNHMAASAGNRWWYDVLEFGQESFYAHYFDVDWEPFTAHGTLKNRVLIPILGRPYGEVLESGELTLTYSEGELTLHYYEHRLPLAPRSYAIVLRALLERSRNEEESWVARLERFVDGGGEGTEIRTPEAAHRLADEQKQMLRELHASEPEFRNAIERTVLLFNGEAGVAQSFDRLDELLEAQWYRLSYWRMASEEINYRRFFDVTDLIGLRVEDPDVFHARHARLFDWAGEGVVTGFRIDHIDGLYDPVSHLRRLQGALLKRVSGADRFYVVVEKILAPGERLSESFAAHGTTGYDFLNIANHFLLDTRNLGRLSEIYDQFVGAPSNYRELAFQSKRQILDGLFAGEVRGLGAKLARLAAHDRNARDFSPADITQALAEVTAAMRVYRTYIRDFHVASFDRDVIHDAVRAASERTRQRTDERLYQFIERVLLLQPPHYAESHREEWLDFVLRWQQFTGRAMAKGIEDTTFYQYNRLISMNEVGGEPELPEVFDPVDSFHANNELQLGQWPLTMNTTSTHDTKRSADVRARIDVLSEMPDVWERHLRMWGRLNHRLKQNIGTRSVPDRNEEFMLYQTLLGVWPLESSEEGGLPDRLALFLEKALREAKTNSSWLTPDIEYEQGVIAFMRAILDPSNEEFLADFRSFQQSVAFYGFLNSLAQLTVKVFSPGVPDFYQGEELWDFSLVDPDNRRQVDYRRRETLLEEVSAGRLTPAIAAERWMDGSIKLLLTAKALQLRNRHRSLFEQGAYVRLTASGSANEHICAFARTDGQRGVIVVVPRLWASLVRPGQLPLGEVWSDQALELPAEASRHWRNVITGEELSATDIGAGEASVRLDEIFRSFPIAVLESAE
jgi:(1->4)-alpha-D-glucan 1-alpha-D-glucosylmutase